MNAPELLPCPFCGENRASTYYVRDGRVAMCPACGAKSGSQFNGPRDIPSADERAISAWNTRTPDAAALARAERAKAELAKARELIAMLEGEQERADNLSDKLELERALTDGAHRRAKVAEALLAEAVEALESVRRFGVITHTALAILARIQGDSHD